MATRCASALWTPSWTRWLRSAMTMPTLLFAFGTFSSVMRPSAAAPTAPTPIHRAALARCLRFINAYGHCGLVYTRAAAFILSAVGDASHGQEIHHVAAGFCKSRSGGAVLACGAVIAAFSSIQQATALSTFESELYALVATVRLLLALRRLVAFILGVTLRPAEVPLVLPVKFRDFRTVGRSGHFEPTDRDLTYGKRFFCPQNFLF
jgi:hypothetical protein